MRRLAELRPALALFGHGPPLRDPQRLAQRRRKFLKNPGGPADYEADDGFA